MKILVVDDDAELRALIGFALRQAGFLVVEAPDGPRAVATHEQEAPDLVILDVNLPFLDGFEVLKRIRARGRTPVMMLTVRAAEEDLVRGLDAGADDYLAKPFSPRTLLARVRALLRRSGSEPSATLRAGRLELDPDLQAVRIDAGEPVRLTPLEFRLLQYLVAQSGRTVHADRLLAHVWGAREGGDRQTLKQLVHRLRHKIEDDPARPVRVVTVAGLGYALRDA